MTALTPSKAGGSPVAPEHAGASQTAAPRSRRRLIPVGIALVARSLGGQRLLPAFARRFEDTDDAGRSNGNISQRQHPRRRHGASPVHVQDNQVVSRRATRWSSSTPRTPTSRSPQARGGGRSRRRSDACRPRTRTCRSSRRRTTRRKVRRPRPTSARASAESWPARAPTARSSSSRRPARRRQRRTRRTAVTEKERSDKARRAGRDLPGRARQPRDDRGRPPARTSRRSPRGQSLAAAQGAGRKESWRRSQSRIAFTHAHVAEREGERSAPDRLRRAGRASTRARPPSTSRARSSTRPSSTWATRRSSPPSAASSAASR